jgi:hypothetical protein
VLQQIIHEYHAGLRFVKELCDSFDQRFGAIGAELEQFQWVGSSKLRKELRQLNQLEITTNLNPIGESFFWD